MIKLKDGTPEQKFKQIERILNRMSRKLHKTVVGVMPPIPVMFSTEAPAENGEIFKFLVPATGNISDVCMFVRKFEGNEPIEFTAKVLGETTGSSATFKTRKSLSIENIDLLVSAGDMLTLDTTSPDKISGIWIAFLYHMKMDRKGQEKFLAEELLKLTEMEDEDA